MITVEPAGTLAHAEAILVIDGETFRDCTRTAQEILEQVIRPEYPAWIAYRDGTAVGFMCLMHVKTLHYTACWVDLIAVLPGHQGRGIARKLIEAAEDHCRKAGSEFISALVRSDNTPSLAVFRNRGFEPMGDGFQLMVRNLGG